MNGFNRKVPRTTRTTPDQGFSIRFDILNRDSLLSDPSAGRQNRSLRLCTSMAAFYGWKWITRSRVAAHAVADEKHGDVFVPLLSRYVADRESALKAADEALEFFTIYTWASPKR
jgi:hypothetical protein